jgi:hypothetical protein
MDHEFDEVLVVTFIMSVVKTRLSRDKHLTACSFSQLDSRVACSSVAGVPGHALCVVGCSGPGSGQF